MKPYDSEKYNCPDCRAIKRPNPALIKAGERVRFILEINGQDRNVFGVVIDILDKHFLIEASGERIVLRDQSMVMPEDAPAPLDYVHKAVCKCRLPKLSTISVDNLAGACANA
jgi:hypothetical protein